MESASQAWPAEAEGQDAPPEGMPTGFGPSGRAGAPPVQRVRITFSKEAAARYIGHLDVMRTWERAFRRSRLPLAYTLGYTPHPRLTFAAPLSLGATGEAELMDVYLTEKVPLDDVQARIQGEVTPAFAVVALRELPVEGPALMATTRWADYRVECVARGHEEDEPARESQGSRWSRREAGRAGLFSEDEVEQLAAAGEPWRPAEQRLRPAPPPPSLPAHEELTRRVVSALSAERLPRARTREGKATIYDLRPLILDLWVDAAPERERVRLGMKLRNDAQGAGRPDEVAAVLGLRALLVHRVRIGLEGEAR